MDWEHLLCNERLSGAGRKVEGRSPFNQDYGRVLYSSAFRRLQDKTQVFPLGRNDYVRTRLTHSLEVSNVGRTLAQRLADIIRRRGEADGAPADGIEDIVATACLAHDIGNPPFGHSGEKAMTEALSGTEYAGFSFEGNAQGFRLLTRTCDPIRGCGLDLTAATLGAFTKYPCTEGKVKSVPGWVACKKFGVNEEDLPAFESVAALCGLESPMSGVWCRHPLAYLMEAADDISYLIADLEDAFVAKVIDFSQAAEHLNLLIERPLTGEKLAEMRRTEGDVATIRYLRAIAVGHCIAVVGEVLEDVCGQLLAGEPVGPLLRASAVAAGYEEVQRFSVRHIYNSEQVVRIEITGFNVIRALTELYLQWVERPEGALSHHIAATLHADLARSEDKNYRFMHMVDYISGMTDSYALHTYQSLFGTLHPAF